MANASKKKTAAAPASSSAAKQVRDAIRAKLGKDAARLLGGDLIDGAHVTSIPTGIDVLDHYVLGVGGLPRGRIIEVSGDEGTGKTTFMYTCIAAVQRFGGVGVLLDAEHTFDGARAKVLGVQSPDEIVICQPQHLEELLEVADATLAGLEGNPVPIVAVWDSLAASPPKAEMELGLIGQARVGERARVLSQGMRTLVRRVRRQQLVLVIINQVRDNIGVMFGPKTTTPGGHGVKHAADIRVQLYGGSAVKEGEIHVGKDVTFASIKNRFVPPHRKAKVRLYYDEGWSNDWSTLNLAKDRGHIAKDAKGPTAIIKARKELGFPTPATE